MEKITRKQINISPSRANSLREIKEDTNPDIILSIDSGRISIKATKNFLISTQDKHNKEQLALVKGVNQPFYITLKEEPNFLVHTINVSMDDIVSGKEYTEELNVDPKRISIYTRKYFDSYSLVINDDNS